MPRRFPDNLHRGFLDAIQHQQLLLCVPCDDPAHAAAGGGEGHFDIHPFLAGRQFFQLHVVHEAEVHNIDGYLRIETGFERRPNLFLTHTLGAGHGSRRGRGLGRQPERIGVGARDAEQRAAHPQGATAAEGLRDVDRGAFRQQGACAVRNLNRVAVASEFDGANVLHK